jgi:cyclopropane-fatty-acyl-phospholipid synthase
MTADTQPFATAGADGVLAPRPPGSGRPPVIPDLHRWPDLARPRTAAVRSAAARALLRHAAGRAGLCVELPGGRCYGVRSAPVLRVRREGDFFRRLGRDGNIGFGEAYLAGDWDSPDLPELLTALARQVGTLIPAPLQALRRFHDARRPAAEDNTRAGARRNVARHYDLSNELFRVFLDPTLSYSAALTPDGGTPPPAWDAPGLAAAQRHKIDRLLDAVGVRPGTELLEIGTGWGELAIRAAARGARVTTITLSGEQAALARRRAADAGLAGRIDVRVQDYRDTRGRYPAIVSVEMIEAVGERWWPDYFTALDRLLAPGGAVGLQAILMPHDRMLASRACHTWIQKYVFPGGLVPSVAAIEQTLARHTRLRTQARLHFGADYARTLRSWRQRFLAGREQIRALGFDEVFLRLWEFYLAYSEAGFRAGYLDVAQFLLRRSHGPAAG